MRAASSRFTRFSRRDSGGRTQTRAFGNSGSSSVTAAPSLVIRHLTDHLLDDGLGLADAFEEEPRGRSRMVRPCEDGHAPVQSHGRGQIRQRQRGWQRDHSHRKILRHADPRMIASLTLVVVCIR
ncbi:hypothetical protein OAO87_00150 [bacterium]|nr:hypothetical protein [bacterium]